MNEYLDHYCERVAPGLWAEPLNFLSNVGFFVVVYFLWRGYQELYRENKGVLPGWKFDIVLLLILIVLIGLGSGLWHLYATPISLWADRIPILLFINIYLLSCLFRVLRCSVKCGIGLFVAYHILNAMVLLSLPLESFNRSLFYLPTWLFLGVITSIVWRQVGSYKHYFVWAFTIFTIAIIYRSIDIVICEAIPIGTHYIWHLLVSFTLYLLMVALIHGYNRESGL